MIVDVENLVTLFLSTTRGGSNSYVHVRVGTTGRTLDCWFEALGGTIDEMGVKEGHRSDSNGFQLKRMRMLGDVARS